MVDDQYDSGRALIACRRDPWTLLPDMRLPGAVEYSARD